ncbi:MAG: hypothetical protein NT130_03710 [Candidatus Micrarchaeota archaeon]|nr:hypothetical protein [Candidatus Micrarchaeota archaeon]
MASLIAGGADYYRREAVRTALRNIGQFQCIVLTSMKAEPTLVEVIPLWKDK